MGVLINFNFRSEVFLEAKVKSKLHACQHIESNNFLVIPGDTTQQQQQVAPGFEFTLPLNPSESQLPGILHIDTPPASVNGEGNVYVPCSSCFYLQIGFK